MPVKTIFNSSELAIRRERRRKRHLRKIREIGAKLIFAVPVIRDDGCFYESMSSAARALGVTKTAIRFQLEGKINTVKGHTFEYLYSQPKAHWGPRCRQGKDRATQVMFFTIEDIKKMVS